MEQKKYEADNDQPAQVVVKIVEEWREDGYQYAKVVDADGNEQVMRRKLDN